MGSWVTTALIVLPVGGSARALAVAVAARGGGRRRARRLARRGRALDRGARRLRLRPGGQPAPVRGAGDVVRRPRHLVPRRASSASGSGWPASPSSARRRPSPTPCASGRERPRAYFGLMLLLTGAIVGVFCAQDLLLFYVFWEAMLIPLYLLVGVWGGEGRQRATLLFVIYTMAGSLLMLASIIVFGLSEGTFDLLELRTGATRRGCSSASSSLSPSRRHSSRSTAGCRPHTARRPPRWRACSPASSRRRPRTASSTSRSCSFPARQPTCGCRSSPLAAIGLVYGSLLAFRAGDIRGVIAYSSLAQLGLIMLGLFATNLAGWNGALLQMVNHGLLSATLFMLAGLVECADGHGQLRPARRHGPRPAGAGDRADGDGRDRARRPGLDRVRG